MHLGARLHARAQRPVDQRHILLHILQQAAPHGGLPLLGLWQGLHCVVTRSDLVQAQSPIVQPIGAVVLVPIQDIGHLHGKLVGLARWCSQRSRQLGVSGMRAQISFQGGINRIVQTL